LSIGVGDAEAWRVEVVQEDDFLNAKLEPADVLVLANVASPTPGQAEKMRRLVRDGMGLLIFSGGKLDVGLYNDRLYRSGEPLLPVTLKGQVDAAIRGLLVEQVRPSPIEKLLELRASALERIPVKQVMAVDEPTDPAGAARVLARWNDPARSPAILERTFGAGRVLLWTTTADRAGNDWPIEPSFVLAVREAVRGAARPTSWGNTLTAGERPRKLVQSSRPLTNVRLTAPGGGEPKPLVPTPVADPGRASAGGTEPTSASEIAAARRAGAYRLAWEEGPLGAQGDLFVVNPDPRESPLERLTASELKTMLSPLDVEVVAARGDGSDSKPTVGREVWHEMAWILLILLLLEPLLASWVGRSR
jgi:hypothetical protein